MRAAGVSDLSNANALAAQRHEMFFFGFAIGDEHVNSIWRADEGRADNADLAVVRDDDFLPRLLQQGVVDCRLIGIIGRESVSRMNAVHADERFIHEDFGGGSDRRRADESKPIAAQKSTRANDFHFFAVTQLHGDVDGVGEDHQIAAMAEISSDLSGGGAGADGDGLAVGNKFGSGKTDEPFFQSALLLLLLKRRNVPEGLVEEWLDGLCATVRPAQHAFVFELREVAPNCGRRDFELARKIVDEQTAVAAQLAQNLFAAVFGYGIALVVDVVQGANPLCSSLPRGRDVRKIIAAAPAA